MTPSMALRRIKEAEMFWREDCITFRAITFAPAS